MTVNWLFSVKMDVNGKGAKRGTELMTKIQAVFIDRDGTIGGSDIVEYPGEFQPYPGAIESIKLLKKSVEYIFSFTNQPGIARGEAALEDFQRELKAFGFDHVYLCPHEPHEKCQCRKPKIGMLRQAAEENNLNLKNCAVIGDRWTDMMAAQAAGSLKILVRTGAGDDAYQKYSNNEYFGEWGAVTLDYVADNIKDAIDWVIKNNV
jgi:histidinol-phosphate phosphatase family protein